MTYSENEPITQWLAAEAPEAVLEPDLPIVDPHHHLWDLRGATTEPQVFARYTAPTLRPAPRPSACTRRASIGNARPKRKVGRAITSSAWRSS